MADTNFEPPLSPPVSIGGLRRAPLPEPEPQPVAQPAAPAETPLPTRLLQSGLVTLPQLSAAMQQSTNTGRPLQDILVETGLLSADAVASIDAPAAVPPPPPVAPPPVAPPPVAQPPAPEPVFVAPPEPEPVYVAEPVAPPVRDNVSQALAGLRLAVVAHLENGSTIEVGVYPDAESAREIATQAMRAVAHATDDWPLLGGRYVRPQSVVSIEVSALL